jgi:hypothetical protein
MTRFSPKHKHYAKSISGQARAMMAIEIDSVGMLEYFSQLINGEGGDHY